MLAKKPHAPLEYAQGTDSPAVRESIRKAKPILDHVEKEYPNIDRTLILGCLKQQTIIAESWPTEQDRKINAAWKKFRRALAAANQTPTIEDLKVPEAIGKTIGKKGRPTSWWTDVQALKLADHFNERTGKPRYKLVSALLECAPSIPGLQMSPQHIRQRLDRWKNRDNKQQRLMMKLAGTR